MSKIYTRRGDLGRTALRPGKEVDKHDSAIALLGDLDELNSVLGVAVAGLAAGELAQRLIRTQRQLFLLGGAVAGDPTSRATWAAHAEAWVQQQEQEIDSWTALLPPLRNFILPGGSLGGAHLHWCRTVVRRVERCLSAWSGSDAEWTRPLLTPYLNRLSDWLFTAARFENHTRGVSEPIWSLADETSRPA